jgi:hypothetical protein
VVLSENDQEQWEFRKSMNPNASEHNHEMMAPSEMIKAWPPEVNEMIIYLAQQRLQTHEIRDAVKQRFPLISWNERRFYNRLTEERKRIRQRNTTERTRRLILLASQLCAVVASNEEWSQCVEGDLQRMFENFCHLTRLTPEAITSLVDLQPDDPDRSPSSSTDTHRLSIGTLPDDDTDDSVNQGSLGSSLFKKRKTPGSNNTTRHPQTQSPPPPAAAAAAAMATSQKRGVQCVSIPAFNVYVRSQSLRASSESSQGSRRTWESASGLGSPGSSSFIGNSGNNNGIFSLSSPTSSSSSSSSIPFRQQPFRLDVQQRLTSPPLNASPHDATSFVMPQQQQQQQQQQSYALTNLTYNMQTSFSPYSISTPSFSSPNDMTYTLDNAQTATPATTTAQPSQLPHQLAVSTSRPDHHHHHHHQQQHHQQERPMFGDFCPSIKEERNNTMYDRALSVTGYTTTPLPMIRPNDHSAVPVTSAEPTASYY